ncbi:MAG: sulfotransferase family 2 domain-containing protein [Bacteroidota bacterium]
MPYKEEYKLLFIHIPKTGGTSIEVFFEMNKPENFRYQRWDRDQISFIEQHRHLSKSIKLHYEPQHYSVDILKELIPDYNNYFKFAFVRNPYSRILSEYLWITKKQLNDFSDFNPNDFHIWCENFLSIIDSSHKESQTSFIDESVDFIGRYENFANDFNLLISKLLKTSINFKKIENQILPVLNATSLDKNILMKYILPETKKNIYSTYKSDFIAFSYDNML